MAETAARPDPAAAAGTLVHVGCGAVPDLSRNARASLFVEPDPACLRRLRMRLPADAPVRIVAAAVAGAAGRAPFHRLNMGRLSGLHCPPALFDLLPGLRQIEEIQVKTRPIGDILKEAGLTGQENILVCEAPSTSAALLQDLDALGTLDAFREIEVVCGDEPLFGAATDAASVTVFLEDRGYRAIRRDDEDPDWPRLNFRRDAALMRARERQTLLMRDVAALRAERDAAQTALDETRAARAEQAAALEAARAGQAEALRALEKERDALEARAAEVTALRAERDAAQTALDKTRAAQAEQTAALEAARAEAEDRFENARQDLALALRTQAIAQTDLQELRTRHAALAEKKEAQDTLLAQLLLRLEEATDYLHRVGIADSSPPARDAPDHLTQDSAAGGGTHVPPRQTGRPGKTGKARKSGR